MSNETPKTGTRYLDVFSVLFVTVLIVSMIMAQKLFVIFGTTFTTAIIVFPISYILGDVLTEVYGYARARRVIWLGFVANVVVVLLFEISVVLPPAPGWPLQEGYASILQQVPRTVMASLLAYLCGEFVNSYVLAKMKVLTQGRYLWARTIGSTLFGQAADSAVFVTAAFWGIWPPAVILEVIISAYLFKVLYEAAATPLTYAVVGWVKKREAIDYYDRDTDFNPFRLGGEKRQ